MTFENDKIARAFLLFVAEPPAPALVDFVGEHGPIEAAERVKRADCPREVKEETAARGDYAYAERDLERAAAIGARLVTPEDDEWPARPLRSLATAQQKGVFGMAPPLALWVRGAALLNEVADQAIAIVGARAATEYGEHNASEMGYHLASRGCSVFSGAAYGIDGAAHRGALSAAGTTVAVLGCGIDVGYPAAHASLLDLIAGNGALVSEYPLGFPPARHRFIVRNRLLAALTSATVVVEAGRRSSARDTARTAAALGKIVMALPGSVSSGMSVGCHALIREGKATLVTSAADVLDTTVLQDDDPAKPGAVDDVPPNT